MLSEEEERTLNSIKIKSDNDPNNPEFPPKNPKFPATSTFKINVPDGTTTQYTGCYLKAAYVDPLTSATNVDVSEPVKITITVKESP